MAVRMKINEEKNDVGVISYSITGKSGRHEFFRYGSFLTKEDAKKKAKELKIYNILAPEENIKDK